MPLLLNRRQVAMLFPMEAAIATAKTAFTVLANGLAVMPQRVGIRLEGQAGTHLSMPCYVPGEFPAHSVKVVTVFESNPLTFGLPTTLAHLVLHDAETGALLALMEGNYLTAMRTAAASTIATDL